MSTHNSPFRWAALRTIRTVITVPIGIFGPPIPLKSKIRFRYALSPFLIELLMLIFQVHPCEGVCYRHLFIAGLLLFFHTDRDTNAIKPNGHRPCCPSVTFFYRVKSNRLNARQIGRNFIIRQSLALASCRIPTSIKQTDFPNNTMLTVGVLSFVFLPCNGDVHVLTCTF